MKLTDVDYWTYGAELELSDWDITLPMLTGSSKSLDWTICNSNGIGAQNPRLYRYGGEINTIPTSTISEQLDLLPALKRYYKNMCPGYRGATHIHIRVPGLVTNLKGLKAIQQYIHSHRGLLVSLFEPVRPNSVTKLSSRYWRWIKLSRNTFLTTNRLSKQLSASSVKEFMEAEVPVGKAGEVLWHAQPRVCVNLRQLLQTQTIEFRHFNSTMCPDRLLSAFQWSRDFLRAAISNAPIQALLGKYPKQSFPTQIAYNEQLEIRYRCTAAHSGIPKADVLRHIEMIEGGEFTDDYGCDYLAKNKVAHQTS